MRIFRKALPFFLCAVIILITPYAYSKTTKKEEFPLQTTKQKMILTLWNLDLFEGGVWSRADFLSTVATEYSKDGVLIMVVSHTLESAKKMIESGVLPDMLSFSAGADFATFYAKKLPKISFSGGEINGDCFAYPWCAGGYFLISKNENNQPIDRLFVSQNTYTNPLFAIEENKIDAKEKIKKEPLDAYTAFLSGESGDFLLGTQRDLFRLERRGVEHYAKPLEKFSDIVQYLSVFASGERYDESLKFAEFLIGEKVQKTLGKIGMVSPYFSENQVQTLKDFDFKKITTTISPFTDSSIILNIIDGAWRKNSSPEEFAKFKNVLKRL
ncbi:MAG: hypothetical protein IJW64_05735 [Clostridia bacterium]|nr:hypothetical protein [Clostridia bacterium]